MSIVVDPIDSGETAEGADWLPDHIMVQVIPLKNGRAIAWGDGLAQKLSERAADVRQAIMAGARAVIPDRGSLPVTPDWQVSELTASFGITLTTEAGVVLAKASTEATFEVTVTLTRK